MGIEYSLRFASADPLEVAKVVRQLPMAYESTGRSEFEFRTEAVSAGMPDASAHVEADGLYFCDYGGDGRAHLGRLIALLVSHFGPVTIADRE